jgi:hypothetical protein
VRESEGRMKKVNLENDYLKKDGLVENRTDKTVINLDNSSSSKDATESDTDGLSDILPLTN